MAAVGEVLGDAVTADVAAAWDEVYWLFAAQLIAAEARIYAAGRGRPRAAMRPYRLVRTIEETADVVSFVLEPADGEPVPKTAPGQYVSVFVNLPNGRRQGGSTPSPRPRSAPGCRSPSAGSAGVGGAPDGKVSTYLHDSLEMGDLVELSAPAGDFVLTEADTPLLLASAGAGITTVLPIVEHVAKTQPERTVIVAHADRTAPITRSATPSSTSAGCSTTSPATAGTRRSTDDDSRSRQGLMDLSEIPLPADVQVFTCGPLPFMRHVRGHLIARGMPANRIRYEVFGPDLWAAQIPA